MSTSELDPSLIPNGPLQLSHEKIALSQDPVFIRLGEVTLDTLDLRDDQLEPHARFADDLGADSLDLVELVEALEEEFGVEIDDEELADVATVAEAYVLIASKLT